MSNRVLILCGFCTVWCSGIILQGVNAQFGARNTIPETISSCYQNTTAYNRYNRQPMHINNLIAIIRKIERKEPQWDMRKVAKILVNRYMFDGLQFDPTARFEYQFNPQREEAIKSQIIKNYISIQADEIILPGVLDNDELCSLHWMMSHSMNSTVRDEELGYNPYGTGYNPGGGNGYNTGTGNNPNNNGYNFNDNGNSAYGDSLRRAPRGRRSVDADTNIEEDQLENISQEESPSIDAQNATAEMDNNANEDDTQTPEDDKIPPLLSRSAPAAIGANSEDETSKFARQVSNLDPKKTRRPIETGVVYTNWGSVSAARVIAGIAAGLEPISIPIGGSGSPYPSNGYNSGGINNSPGNPPGGYGYNGAGSNPFVGGGSNNNNNNYNSGSNPSPAQNQYGRKRRQVSGITFQPLKNIHAATLAGDVGQAGIENGKYPITNVNLPRGIWNDTICPREYVLEQYPYSDKEIYMPDAALTYLTEAEIRGGMDGLILGSNIQRWSNAGYKLSELLDMYYSENGISGEPQYRACNRGGMLTTSVDMNEVREQSKSFAYLYNNQSSVIPIQTIERDPNIFIRPIDEAYQKMAGVASTIGSSDPPCTRRQSTASSALDTDDNLKYTDIRSRIYAVLDHTGTYDEIMAQKRFIAQLAYEINVSPKGSRLGVVDGSSGQILINPNHTDINAHVACNVLSLPTQIKTQDISRVLTGLKSEMDKIRSEEERLDYESDLGIVILFLIQGKKLEDSQKSTIRSQIQEFNALYGDAKIIFSSSKYQEGDFEGFLPNPTTDFVKIQASQNISDFADEFAKELTNKAQGRLPYAKCNANKFNQDEEHKIPLTFFVTPDTIQYYQVSPDFFYSSKTLKLRFTSDNGKVRICNSRSQTLPNSRNEGSSCQETKGSYISPGNSQIDVEFAFSKPCGKHGNRNGCGPIYISITPTEYPTAGQGGLDCSVEGCQYPNQVKVTFTHWDMRCNGAFKTLISLPMALTTLMLSLLVWKNST